jgi:hypothetical protein
MPILTPTVDASALFAAQRQREAQEHERLRVAVGASAIPLPDELVKAVVMRFGEDAQAILRAHPGYPLHQVRESYLVSVQVMDVAIADLLGAITTFAEEAVREGGDLFDYLQRDRLRQVELRIQKELFAATNAAMSLVDHSRRLQLSVALAGYDEEVRRCFGDDGLHDFIKALRVLLYHVQVVEAGWLRQNSIAEGKRATFTIGRSLILRTLEERANTFSAGQRGRIAAYLEGKGDHVDLSPVFTDYRDRSAAFNGWMSGQLGASLPAALADYDRCQLEKTRFSVRTQWSAVLGNWLSNVAAPHVHRHLPKFLDAGQLAQVYGLPLNSPEQAEKVLELMDRSGAADDDLRERVHTLFARATTDGAPPGALTTVS